MRSTAPTRFAACGHDGLLMRNGSNSSRTPFGDVIRNVEWPSHVTFRPRSAAREETESGSADGNRIEANYIFANRNRRFPQARPLDFQNTESSRPDRVPT